VTTACIDIVIVNWNSRHLLAECIESIRQHHHGLVANVIVVDNGSTDGSHLIRLDFPPARIVEAGQNLGFARACNVGASGSQAEFLLFLNPDARLTEGCLPTVYDFMRSETSRNVGICGIKLVDDTGHVQKTTVRFPTAGDFVARALGLDLLLPRLFKPFFNTDFDHEQDRVVDQVIGAFYFVRGDLYSVLGGMDERFFVYFEDLDFAYRARRAGWVSYHLAGTHGFHEGGGTSNQVKAHRLFYSMRSRLLYAAKHFAGPQAALVAFATIGIEPLTRLLHQALQGSARGVRDTWCGYRMLWADLGAIARKVRDPETAADRG
jgi:GT2 family glycosyltransferase